MRSRKKILDKIIRRFKYELNKLVRRDSFTGAKISSRKDLKNIGSKYGGWVVPKKLFNENSICYCVGCGEDISFDLGLMQLFGCDVYGFDPTPRAIHYVRSNTADNPNYHFYDIGLWDKEDTLEFFAPKNPSHVSHSLLNLQKTGSHILVKVDRLSHVMQNLGHERLDLLKIDIEGAEYKVIESIIADEVEVQVLCVEYDEYFNSLDADYKARIQDSMKLLIDNGYLLVFTQGNGNYTFVKSSC